MKIKAIFFSLLLMLILMPQGHATQLPQDIKNYLINQTRVPSIRHDGIIVYGNDVMYLPVFPAYPEKVDEVKITKTYPIKQTMSSFPDIIVFNNNFGLLRIIRTDENTLTVRNLEEYPIEIKTGEIPQDLLVPHGFIMPEKLAGILGDVYIPLSGSAKSGAFVTGKKAPLPTGKRLAETKKYSVPEKLKNKLFFVNNYQNEYLKVFSSTVSEPLYSLKTSGVMRDVKPALNGKYLLAATKGSKNIDVIDVAGEFVAKRIDLTANPEEIAVDDKRGKAYISSIDDESLIVLDLKSLRVIEKIQLAGAPKKLSVSPDGNKIAYLDISTSNIFVLELDNDYLNKLITNYPNTSKIILENDTIYLIARTEPKLRVVTFDLLMDNKSAKTRKDKKQDKIKQIEMKQAESENVTSDIFTGLSVPEKDDLTGLKAYATSIKDIKTGMKPVDMYKYGNDVFVLCAGDNTVYKYDIPNGAVTNSKLPTEGFARSFTPVLDSNIAVITNMADFKYVVYDMEQAKPLQTIPISDYVNSITILERNNEQ